MDFSEGIEKDDELVLFFIVRKDLKMNRGKIAAQVGHAVQYLLLNPKEPKLVQKYLLTGTVKLVKRCETLQELEELEEECHRKKIPCRSVIDFGRTQVAPNTKTVLGIGPRPRKELDPMVRKFPLYS